MRLLPINTKTLTFRITTLVILTVLITGVILLILLFNLFSEFVTNHIQNDMERHSSAIYSIGDQSLNSLLHKRQSANEIAIKISKAHARSLIDEYMRRYQLTGIILTPEEEVYRTEGFPGDIKIENILHQDERSLIESISEGQKFYVYRLHFEPWNWQVILARDSVAYTSILTKIKTASLFVLLLFCFGTFLLIFYLQRNINYPVRSIIDSLERKRPPSYNGVQEFEFLSKHIAGMMLHLKNSHDLLENRVEERTEELKISEEKYRSIFEQSNDSIILHNFEGIIVDANERAGQLLGYSLQGLRHLALPDFFLDTERGAFQEALHKTLEQGFARFESKLVRADNTILDVDISSRITNREQGIVQAIMRDNTEKKLLKEERIRSSKLESIGVLAGGIAHDFNNILAGILGNLTLAKTKFEENNTEDGLRGLSICEKAVNRAKHLSYQLLTFSKGGTPVTKPTDSVTLVRESVGFALTGTSVAAYYVMDEHVWPVEVDANQINQVIQNIVTNAVQAMPEGGSIMIRVENVQIGESLHQALVLGEYVKMSFSDTGSGISDDIIDKIFVPYFSSKDKGSGLGLAISYSIMKQHGGDISVDRTGKNGSTFAIHLPACKDRHVRQERKEEQFSHGNGAILVMDDEEIIRDMLANILGSAGYKPVCACNGKEAVTLFREAISAGAPFDAVILDLTIPGGMGGKETVQHLKKINPEVKCIVSSGYSADPVLANYSEYGFVGMVEKPYEVQQLLSILTEVLIGV